jgi:hypothetical protein
MLQHTGKMASFGKLSQVVLPMKPPDGARSLETESGPLLLFLLLMDTQEKWLHHIWQAYCWCSCDFLLDFLKGFLLLPLPYHRLLSFHLCGFIEGFVEEGVVRDPGRNL